jgi:hypothetical protein
MGRVPWTAFRNVIRSALVSANLGFVNASAPRLFVARLRNRVLSVPSSRLITTMLPEGMCLLDFNIVRETKLFDTFDRLVLKVAEMQPCVTCISDSHCAECESEVRVYRVQGSEAAILLLLYMLYATARRLQPGTAGSLSQSVALKIYSDHTEMGGRVL